MEKKQDEQVKEISTVNQSKKEILDETPTEKKIIKVSIGGGSCNECS